MSGRHVRIATRNSPLALAQAELVRAELHKHHPQLSIEFIGMTTEGDIHLATPLAKVGGKGLFVKELEKALLSDEADIAVHSIKDIPVAFPKGLILSTICQREDPRDTLISNHFRNIQDLPKSARIGTSSLRRQSQIKNIRPDLQVQSLRGNVQTRLRKLDEGEFDAIVLASAGLKRLHLSTRITQVFETDILLPAVGQGAIGIECREDDLAIQHLLKPINHYPTEICILAERAFNKHLEGGCQVPIAGHAVIRNEKLYLQGLVAAPDGSRQIRGEIYGELDEAEKIGNLLAQDLLHKGAGEILRAVYNS